MTKRKLGVRIETVDLTDGPFLDESIKSTKWRKRGRREKMPQPKPRLPSEGPADLWNDYPMQDWGEATHDDPPSTEVRAEKLPVRSKVVLIAL